MNFIKKIIDFFKVNPILAFVIAGISYAVRFFTVNTGADLPTWFIGADGVLSTLALLLGAHTAAPDLSKDAFEAAKREFKLRLGLSDSPIWTFVEVKIIQLFHAVKLKSEVGFLIIGTVLTAGYWLIYNQSDINLSVGQLLTVGVTWIVGLFTSANTSAASAVLTENDNG